MKHTHGPWYESNTGNHQGLIIEETTGRNVAVTYDKADAALIAAAPEMLKLITEIANDTTHSIKGDFQARLRQFTYDLNGR